MWGCECINEPQGFVCVLGPSPASLIPARHIKATGDDVATRCLYMVLPASSMLWCRESRPELGPADHIWPGVVSPAAILPASTACCQDAVAPLPPSCRLSLFSPISPPSPPPPYLSSEENTFEPCPDLFLCSLWPLITALLSPVLPVTVLSFLPKPASSAHPLSPCFPLLSSFLCTFLCYYFLCFPFSPLSFSSRKHSHLGLFQCAGSTGRLCWHLVLNHLCRLAHAFANSLTCTGVCTQTLLCVRL